MPINQQTEDWFVRTLHDEVKNEVAKLLDAEAEKAADEVRKKVRMLAGSIATKVMSDVRVERMGLDLCIRVRIDQI